MAAATWNGTVIAESDKYEIVEGKANSDAAWYYPTPLDAAKKIKDHVAFWNGVEVEE